MLTCNAITRAGRIAYELASAVEIRFRFPFLVLRSFGAIEFARARKRIMLNKENEERDNEGPAYFFPFDHTRCTKLHFAEKRVGAEGGPVDRALSGAVESISIIGAR